jgi:hypothetical protein
MRILMLNKRALLSVLLKNASHNYEYPPLGGGASPVSYEIAKDYVNSFIPIFFFSRSLEYQDNFLLI